ncbi:ubiquinol-cytochrome C chaperone family protein [Enterovirga rhinocerotis]|uniref:ubiquinol-cytochrome C chaperone family protein n=1 Tax=Enterovirga rhinocerotis TaxID=1339210 RepID=UPI001FDEA6D2|nr:ubiquinol-cytochrome C chaperone family protein [Enterovirga rhinocerotis]
MVDRFHAAVVDASRDPRLFGDGGFPDTIEGRFESLVLHVMLVLRRLRNLPAPAGDMAQDLVDTVFAHLEIALRESGVGDMGVPKRMKKLGRAFYDRTAKYEAALEARDPASLAAELAKRLGGEAATYAGLAEYCLASETTLASRDLDGLLKSVDFSVPSLSGGMS